MQQQQICGLLKQILPQLEQKIRCELQAQYEQKLNQLQRSYEQQIQILLNRQNQLKSQLEKVLNILANKNDHEEERDKQQLYKRISVLQSQRKNWGKLQLQYQASIKQMTTLISDMERGRSLANTSTISNSMINCSNTLYNSVNTVHPPPKCSVLMQNICKPFKKQKIGSRKQSLSSQTSVKPNDQASQISESAQNSLCRYINRQKQPKQNDIKQNMNQNNENKEHYHSVLSPPKQEDEQEKRVEQQVQGKKIFWDQSKKKQLLSLIKFN